MATYTGITNNEQILGQPIQLSSGRVLLTYCGIEDHPTSGLGRSVNCIGYSDNNGATWTTTAIAHHNYTTGIGSRSLGKFGSTLVTFRTHDFGGNYNTYYYSTDNGETWAASPHGDSLVAFTVQWGGVDDDRNYMLRPKLQSSGDYNLYISREGATFPTSSGAISPYLTRGVTDSTDGILWAGPLGYGYTNRVQSIPPSRPSGLPSGVPNLPAAPSGDYTNCIVYRETNSLSSIYRLYYYYFTSTTHTSEDLYQHIDQKLRFVSSAARVMLKSYAWATGYGTSWASDGDPAETISDYLTSNYYVVNLSLMFETPSNIYKTSSTIEIDINVFLQPVVSGVRRETIQITKHTGALVIYYETSSNGLYINGVQRIDTDVTRPEDWIWESTVAAGEQVLITAVEWNNFTTRINDFREYLSITTYSFTTAVQGNPLLADYFNEAKEAIDDCSPSTSTPDSVVSGDPIVADEFNLLKDSLNSIP